MARPPVMPALADEFENPANLLLDVRNPRNPDETFESEDEVINYLVDHADIDELVQSILNSGWLDYEPLIVLAEDNVVLEGNRRLVALRILADPELRARLNYSLETEPDDHALPTAVRICRVSSRSAARDYIGFKHINGPFKWDALAKAKYATEWFEDGDDIRHISRRIGDGHNTVVRLVNGWRVLRQSLENGFQLKETTKKSFPFSHLYTGLSRPSVRRYLGLSVEEMSAVLPVNPVSECKLPNLRTFMSWLYGQRNETALIRSQNPDLNRLVEVMGNENARLMLEANRDLDIAYGQVEDKNLRFSQTLMNTIRQAEDTISLVGSYDGRQDLMSAGDNLRRTVLSLHIAMRRVRDIAEAGNDGDGD